MLKLQGGVVDILCSPKSRGGLNPSLVEGLISHLEAINSTHAKDFSPEGILSLDYPHLITVLLSFFYGLLNLLQLLLQDPNLFIGCSQLVLGLAKLFALTLWNFGALLVSVSFLFSSQILFSTTLKPSTAAMCLPSSSFIYQWELFTNSLALCATWTAFKYIYIYI